ncbi:hypothetical protein Mgra_00004864 [Meloidogyne graminicola]|uniref:Adenylate kinase n=1 Tax=Meloidogyne graminicola TaxID=189291 RepID=A0A8S9ZRA8_9BILA|nr:hypothetical protein Mgra_00004864 [Meloidogyne graminicola]
MGCAPSVHNWNGFVSSHSSSNKFKSPCCEFILQNIIPGRRRGDNNATGTTIQLENDEIDLNLHRLLRLQPPITIDVGSGVDPACASGNDYAPKVIFIFGGPGSMKGILTQELAQEFDFVTIGIEDVIFTYLPQKEANTVQNTVEINELLRRNPGIINLRWVLQMVSAKIATSHSNAQRFIVDIIPELSFIIKSAAFTTHDHKDQLLEFDRKYKILFALELYISAEYQLLESGPSSSFSASPSTSKSKKETDEERELRLEARQLLRGGADEADKGRLEKRLESFHECAEPFLAFFRKHKRIVRLDLKDTLQ